MRYLKTISIILVTLLLGCKGNMEEGSAPASYESLLENAPQNEEPIQIERKLIKDGNISFETDNLETTKNTITTAVKKYKAYIASDQEYRSAGSISNTIIIRVPKNNFDNLLADITKGITEFDGKEIKVKDVTEEFLDVSARLKTKKELEIRYLEILKKANTVKEILEVERELEQLRSDIESIEGRLKYLENKTSLATLTITYYQSISNQTQFGNKFKEGFKNGSDNLIWFFVFLVNIWPFLVILLIIAFILKKWRKRRRVNKLTKNE